ncbi:sensor histidine kinase [Actinomadura fulvescens]|uniref:histidine kinase n=1 Tax=Actinomadura fulvescens TaxID=46160 RepID=A0ABN3Q335_9ACTN
MLVASRPSLPRRLPPRVRGALIWCLALPYPAVMHAAMASGRQGFTALEILAIAAFTAVVFDLLRRRPLPALALLLAGWFIALNEMPNTEVGYLELLVTDLAVGFIAATRPPRVSITASVMALTTHTASAAVSVPGTIDLVIALAAVAVAAVWVAGSSVRERRVHAEELAAQATDQAVTAERLRIARELHDMVAHSIGVIAIQAGVGNRVIDTQPGEARNALAAIEATSRETLTGLRAMLVALRRSEAAPLTPAPGLADLDRLASTTLDAGVRVDLQYRGSRRPLPPDLDLSAFRIIQEAVTNVVRHANTPRCRVLVDYQDDALAIEITDDGPGHASPGTGYGITGMRERVSLLNGHFSAGPRPGGGFRVAARLPV